jgi:thymidylate synthase (FAD)
MKIINSSFEIINVSHHDPLYFIEYAARTCYKSEDKITEDSSRKFVQSLINRGHEAMIEHVSISAKVICDRGVTHEIVRHRVASYAQESTRYCNYSKEKFGNEITVIEPLFWDKHSAHYGEWEVACRKSEKSYFELINNGSTPQEARSILPNSLKTEIIVTMNLREWRHFFKLRCAKDAHPQMKEIAIKMLIEFRKRIAIIFDDIEYDTEFERKYLMS